MIKIFDLRLDIFLIALTSLTIEFDKVSSLNNDSGYTYSLANAIISFLSYNCPLITYFEKFLRIAGKVSGT